MFCEEYKTISSLFPVKLVKLNSWAYCYGNNNVFIWDLNIMTSDINSFIYCFIKLWNWLLFMFAGWGTGQEGVVGEKPWTCHTSQPGGLHGPAFIWPGHEPHGWHGENMSPVCLLSIFHCISLFPVFTVFTVICPRVSGVGTCNKCICIQFV